MKQRIRVVVVENEKLRSELKAKAVDESLKDYTIRNSTVICARVKIIGLIFVIVKPVMHVTMKARIVQTYNVWNKKDSEVALWLSRT